MPDLPATWTEKLLGITSAFSRAHTAREVGAVAVALGVEALGAAAGALGLLHGPRLDLVASAGLEEAERARWAVLPLADGNFLSEAVRAAAPVFRDERRDAGARAAGLAAGSHLAVPLLSGDRAVGYLAFGFAGWVPIPVAARSFLHALAAQATQALDRTHLSDEVARSQRLFEGIADASPDMLYLLDLRRGRHVYVSRSVEQVLGLSPRQVAALGDRFLDALVHPDDLPRLREENARFGALPEGELLDHEYRMRHADGSWRWLRTRDRVFSRAPGGEPELLLGVARDVTQYVRADQERDELLAREQQARRDAETASRAKDEFLAMLGHELRNPLSPIMTALELMRLRDADAFAHERTIVERQVQHLTRLVDDLLDVSRITRGKVELKRRPVEMGEVVAAAIELASPLLEGRRHRLEVDVPRSGLGVEGDPERLAQVLSNLLTNAAKYTEPGGRVVVRARREGGRVAVAVRDSGMGMSAELLPRVFDLFVQSPRALDRSQGGLGLGLAIARSLVEMHGGEVRAASDGPGRGSEFTVRLPALAREALTPPPAPGGAEPGRRPVPRGRRVLVVDDNQDAADALVEALEAFGYAAEVAYDGPSALELAARAPPEAAFLDIGLPVMDGYELAQRLREHVRRVKLVALTGYAQDRDRALTRAAGFDEHLVKPVDLSRVLSLLHDLLEGAALSDAAAP